MIIVGIDPSINTVGVAITDCKKGVKTIKELFLVKTHEKDILRLPELYEDISKVIKTARLYDTNITVVIEKPLKYTRKTKGGKSQNVKSVVELNNAFSIIYLAVFHEIFDKDRIKTPDAPSGYGKNRKGLPTKERARYILKAHFKNKVDLDRIEKSGNNETDALMLTVWGCQ